MVENARLPCNQNRTTMITQTHLAALLLSALCHGISFAQTSLEEYNYVTKGYALQIQGGLDMKRGYYFVDSGQFEVPYSGFSRSSTIKILHREADSAPCATMLIHRRTDTNFIKYVCIPHVDSGSEIWKKAKDDYWAAMYDWDEAAKAFSWNLMRSMALKTNPQANASGGFVIDEVMPSFPGGEAALKDYLRDNVRYPKTAISSKVGGTVFVSFIVTKEGAIRDASVTSGIGGGCDEEAIRVVNNMPRWSPGKQRGKEVDVKYGLSIRFNAP